MLGRKVVEGQQLVAVLDQAFCGLGILRLESFNEQFEGGVRVFTRFGLPTSRDITA